MATAGPSPAGTTATDTSIGSKAWGTTNNIKLDDGTPCNSAGQSSVTVVYTYYMKATNFGFSVPSGATINGVTVTWQTARARSDGTAKDYVCKLVKGGAISGDNKAVGTDLTTSYVDYSYGGSSNLWGLSLSDSDINASNFGAVISYEYSGNGTNNQIIRVDYMTITVTYTEAAVTLKQSRALLGVGW